MAGTKLSDKVKERLRRQGDSRDAKSYGEWLGAIANEDDSTARLAALREDTRSDVGYGAGGDALAGSGLSDDGYAAYLRHAAKEARRARWERVEAAREGRDTATLRGYADYLASVREASGERLADAAERLTAAPITEQEADEIIVEAGGGREAALDLKRTYRTLGKDKADVAAEKNSTRAVIAYLKEAQLPYQRAYEYCLSLGYSQEEATELAALAESDLDELTKQLHGLFQ